MFSSTVGHTMNSNGFCKTLCCGDFISSDELLLSLSTPAEGHFFSMQTDRQPSKKLTVFRL